MAFGLGSFGSRNYVNLISVLSLKLITVENYRQTKTFSFRYPGEENSTGNFIGNASQLNTGSYATIDSTSFRELR